MKRPLRVRAILLFFIISFSVLPIAASASSLTWGVQVGDQFSYALQRKLLDTSYVPLMPPWMSFVLKLNEGDVFTATVTQLDNISETISSAQDMPFSHVWLSTDNGTTNIKTDASQFVVPIGDWDLQTTLLNVSELPDVTLVNTDTEWGISEDSSFVGGTTAYTYLYEWRYGKEQGTLDSARYRLSTYSGDHIDVIMSKWSEGDPTVLPPEIQPSTILILATAGTVGVIVAFLIYRWVKTPRGLAAQLGK
jgi:hypothetical protein